MIRVKLGERADKMEVMRKKKVLKDGKEKIQDNWTWKESNAMELRKDRWEERR